MLEHKIELEEQLSEKPQSTLKCNPVRYLLIPVLSLSFAGVGGCATIEKNSRPEYPTWSEINLEEDNKSSSNIPDNWRLQGDISLPNEIKCHDNPRER